MDIWFTSDTHFNHENIIKYCDRPFSCLEEMEGAMFENWNSVVKRGDLVYHLGDFAITWGKRGSERVLDILSRLNGCKHLIRGNHDRKEIYKSSLWDSVDFYKEIKPAGRKIVLCHYSMRVWNQCHRGSWMLFGHSHGALLPEGLSMDVGVDSNNFSPISLDTVSSIIKRG